ncbi:hypothetical protein [Alteromonas facilis]|uniref:hypothetical protein n=1 Tax=Alteromonas facilis TaxID=2048004 RepID=UPI000C295396|nr:hypothetical protein [Alteromonas facilis]
MKNAVRWIKAWLIASVVTYLLASIAHSQFVLLELLKIDIDVSASQWVSMTASDLAGLGLTYGPVIMLSLLIAFLSLTAVSKYILRTPNWVFVVGGALAIAIMLLAMQPILNVTLIAGARSTLGFLSQCCAGLVGGWTFARLSSR